LKQYKLTKNESLVLEHWEKTSKTKYKENINLIKVFINPLLKKHKKEVLINSIDNYFMLLNNKKYYMDNRYSITEFFTGDIYYRFTERGTEKLNYNHFIGPTSCYRKNGRYEVKLDDDILQWLLEVNSMYSIDIYKSILSTFKSKLDTIKTTNVNTYAYNLCIEYFNKRKGGNFTKNNGDTTNFKYTLRIIKFIINERRNLYECRERKAL